jgi:hypothetical protein
VERTVRQDNTISFRAMEYRLKHIEGIRPGKKVRVVLRPYHWPEVAVVFNDIEYLAQPVGKLAGGFSADAAIIGQEFKAQPDTPVVTVRKANENLAFGEERKKNDIPFGGTLQIFGHQADKIGAVPMPRRGTPMELGREIVVQEIPIMELFKRLRAADVTVTSALNHELRTEFGTSIEVKKAEAVVAALVEKQDWRQVEPARAAL